MLQSRRHFAPTIGQCPPYRYFSIRRHPAEANSGTQDAPVRPAIAAVKPITAKSPPNPHGSADHMGGTSHITIGTYPYFVRIRWTHDFKRSSTKHHPRCG